MYRNTVLLILAGLVCTGCGSMPWNKDQNAPPVELLDETEAATVDKELGASNPPPLASAEALPPAGRTRFKDVPLPQGVKEDEERTYVYESATIQVGRMVYTCKTPVTELAQFYIRECPSQGWSLENVLQAEGVQLAFKKPGKRLNVNIRPQGVGRPQLLVLTLTPVE